MQDKAGNELSTTIQPEIQELKEGGYIQRARDELMRSSDPRPDEGQREQMEERIRNNQQRD